MNDQDFNQMFGDGDPPDPLIWLILVIGIVAFVFWLWLVSSAQAFELPAYHLVWIQDGRVVQSVEDYTLPECKSLANHYRKRARARCVLQIEVREYT